MGTELMGISASFEGVTVHNGKLKKGMRSWSVADCAAQVDNGAAVAARVTATRVAVGTVLLPGIGTLVGALAKKDRNKVFLAVTVPGDLIIVDAPAKKEAKARQFAAKVNEAAKYEQARAIRVERDRQHGPKTPLEKALAREAAEAAADSVSAVTPPALPVALPPGWYPNGNVQQYWDGAAWTDHTAPLPPTSAT